MTRMSGGSGAVVCAADPERMFPVAESGKAGRPTDGEWRALRVCGRCPLLVDCRSVVLGMDLPYGVAGGLTAADRRAVRAEGRTGTEAA